MSQRTYFYCRVSTTEQTTANQIQAFIDKGYDVNPEFVIEDSVSGSVQAMERRAFRNMVDNKLASGDTLVVLKLDRLGRDNIDVQQTIDMLLKRSVHVHCLDLPCKDLSTSEGKLMLQMFGAFAEFERNRIRERTLEGQARAKAEGKKIGRPIKVSSERVKELRKTHSLSQVAQLLGVSVSTVKRLQSAD